MNLITKLPPRAYIQRVRRNRGIYCDVNAPKCTSVFFTLRLSNIKKKIIFILNTK